jgi:hypothetical protein
MLDMGRRVEDGQSYKPTKAGSDIGVPGDLDETLQEFKSHFRSSH